MCTLLNLIWSNQTIETFEGLGIGSRLAHLQLPAQLNWIPIAGAFLYGITTPIGIAVGLGIRGTYNPGSATASIVSGVLDALSSGILVYTGLVEVRVVMSVKSAGVNCVHSCLHTNSSLTKR